MHFIELLHTCNFYSTFAWIVTILQNLSLSQFNAKSSLVGNWIKVRNGSITHFVWRVSKVNRKNSSKHYNKHQFYLNPFAGFCSVLFRTFFSLISSLLYPKPLAFYAVWCAWLVSNLWFFLGWWQWQKKNLAWICSFIHVKLCPNWLSLSLYFFLKSPLCLKNVRTKKSIKTLFNNTWKVSI